MILAIGSKKMLRVEKWKDKHGHWRAGIEWYGEDEYEFIVEKPSLKECLTEVCIYMGIEIDYKLYIE